MQILRIKMNPESQYPELATMSKDELFIEKASIMLNNTRLVLYIKKVVPKNEWQNYAKEVKATYNCDSVYFMTIEK